MKIDFSSLLATCLMPFRHSNIPIVPSGNQKPTFYSGLQCLGLPNDIRGANPYTGICSMSRCIQALQDTRSEMHTSVIPDFMVQTLQPDFDAVKALDYLESQMEVENGDDIITNYLHYLLEDKKAFEEFFLGNAPVDWNDEMSNGRRLFELSVKFFNFYSGPILKILLDHGLPINLQNSQGRTTLLIAVYTDDFEWTKDLLSKGADPNIIPKMQKSC